MSSIGEAFAKNLEKLRKEHSLTQQELAEKIGTTRQSIARYESGKGGITLDTIGTLAKFFNIEETDLVAPEKPTEKVELNKNHWKVLDEYFEQHSPSKKPKSEAMKDLHGVPQDILDGLTSIDPRLQETAWKTIRAVIATFGKPGKSSSEAG